MLEAANFARLEPWLCFRWEYFCLIECLWIARLCFCCVAQTNRCGVRDGAGGDGGLGATTSPPRGCPRAAYSSPVPAHARALGAHRYWRRCKLSAFSRLQLAPFRLSPPLAPKSHPSFPPPSLGRAQILSPAGSGPQPFRADSPGTAAGGNAAQSGTRGAGGVAPGRAGRVAAIPRALAEGRQKGGGAAIWPGGVARSRGA